MTDVTKELENAKQNIRGLTAQLDATKMLFNETINSSLQVRSSCIILQQDIQERYKEIANLKADLKNKDVEIDDLTNRLVAANNELTALKSPPTGNAEVVETVPVNEVLECEAA